MRLPIVTPVYVMLAKYVVKGITRGLYSGDNMIEANLDGLVGPTHHYGGLGVGNRASLENAKRDSFPRKGALQGLAKMWKLASLGIKQGVLPPCIRPNPQLLSRQGFVGTWREILCQATQDAPDILSASYSSAFMWTANAATVSPSINTLDKRLHLTIANLVTNLHRSQEAEERMWMLQQCFESDRTVVVHSPLTASFPLRDEGAANHMRLWGDVDRPGIEIFVYGDSVSTEGHDEDRVNLASGGATFIARQSRAASQAIGRLHQLNRDRNFYLQQKKLAIQAGAFHNDVVATSHENLWIYHQDAFDEPESNIESIEKRFEEVCGRRLLRIEVPRTLLSLEEAIACYLFNSQIVTLPKMDSHEVKRMLLLAPTQCEQLPAARCIIDGWISDSENPIAKVEYVSLDQSMSNGGGPACLRLRVPLTLSQYSSSKSSMWLDEANRDWLEAWITRCYPERLAFSDLSEPSLGVEAWNTIRELYKKFEWREPAPMEKLPNL